MIKDSPIDLHVVARRAMQDMEFRVGFPSSVIEEVDRLKEPIFKPGATRDMSDRLWSSIDNDDSRDLDQAEYVETEGDSVRAYVAVAEVNYFVPKGSLTDTCARYKTTSIYTGIENFPMLPDRLSTSLCSLMEGKKRLAIVIEMKIGPDGKVATSDAYPAIIQNKAQLTYEAVHAWLAEIPPPASAVSAQTIAKIKRDPALQEQLRIQDRLADSLRAFRQENGALDFRIPPPPPITDEAEGERRWRESPNRATRIIEEMMIATNGAVDTFLESRNSPLLQRVVRTPKNWLRMVEVAATYQGHLPESPDSAALERFLAEQRRSNPEHFPDIAIAMIKLLGRGEYVVKAPGDTSLGHFALAVPNYAHSTAPNRRYPDLITQRLLHAAFAKASSPYTITELQKLAAHCSAREEDANKVERQVKRCITAFTFQTRIGEEYTGFVTGKSDGGTWIRVPDPALDGWIPGPDRGGEGSQIAVGAKVRVRLISTDPARGFIDFALLDQLAS